MRARDGGQALPLAAVLLALGMVGTVATGRLVVTWVDAARARTAADAAALACLQEGPAAAAAAARANGAQLARAVADEAGCQVTVTRGGASAAARAEWRDAAPSTPWAP
jgi:Flp pilus assembly protein TadG